MLIKKILTRCLVAALATFAVLGATAARADVIVYTNFNGNCILNGHNSGSCGTATALNTSFTLSTATYVTALEIYHFGDPGTTDTLTLKLGATTIGAFAASQFFEPGDTTHKNMLAAVNLLLAAGTYTVFDTRNDYWASNAATGGYGMLQVFASTVPAPGALTLLGLGLLGLGSLRRKRV